MSKLQEKTNLDLEYSPEGSLERRWSRRCLMDGARAAKKEGKSYYGWLENEDQGLLDSVPQIDIDHIYFLVWHPEKR